METWKDRHASRSGRGSAAGKIHRQIEELLDAWRRVGTPEATIAEAIGLAARESAALSIVSKRMGGG